MSRRGPRRSLPPVPPEHSTPLPGQNNPTPQQTEHQSTVIDEELYTNMEGLAEDYNRRSSYATSQSHQYPDTYQQQQNQGYPDQTQVQGYNHPAGQEYADEGEIYENFPDDMPQMQAPPVPDTHAATLSPQSEGDDDESEDEEEQKQVSPEKAKEFEDLRDRLSLMMKLKVPSSSPQQQETQIQTQPEFKTFTEDPYDDVQSSRKRTADSARSSTSSGYNSSSASGSFRSSETDGMPEYYTNVPLHTIEPGRPYVPPISEEEEEEVNDLNSQPYYVKDTSREVVTKAIESVKQEGCFLLRDSVRGGASSPYTLGVFGCGKMWNLQIQIRENGTYALGSKKDQEFTSSTVQEVIEYYRTHDIILAKSGKYAGLVKLKSSPTIP